MFAKASSLRIDAPPEAVFDYVADIGRHPEWAHEKMDIEPLEGDSSRYKAVVHFMGAIPTEINVVASERPRRLAYEVWRQGEPIPLDVRPGPRGLGHEGDALIRAIEGDGVVQGDPASRLTRGGQGNGRRWPEQHQDQS